MNISVPIAAIIVVHRKVFLLTFRSEGSLLFFYRDDRQDGTAHDCTMYVLSRDSTSRIILEQ